MATKKTPRYGPPLPASKPRSTKQDQPSFGGDVTRSQTYYRAMAGEFVHPAGYGQGATSYGPLINAGGVGVPPKAYYTGIVGQRDIASEALNPPRPGPPRPGSGGRGPNPYASRIIPASGAPKAPPKRKPPAPKAPPAGRRNI